MWTAFIAIRLLTVKLRAKMYYTIHLLLLYFIDWLTSWLKDEDVQTTKWISCCWLALKPFSHTHTHTKTCVHKWVYFGFGWNAHSQVNSLNHKPKYKKTLTAHIRSNGLIRRFNASSNAANKHEHHTHKHTLLGWLIHEITLCIVLSIVASKRPYTMNDRLIINVVSHRILFHLNVDFVCIPLQVNLVSRIVVTMLTRCHRLHSCHHHWSSSSKCLSFTIQTWCYQQ